MRITSKGQVTIPQDVREAAGFLPGTDVEFVVEADVVRLVKAVEARRQSRGQRAVQALRDHPISGWTTDELLALTRSEAGPEP